MSWRPSRKPSSVEQVLDYVYSMFVSLGNFLGRPSFQGVIYDPVTIEPTKRKEGLLVYASGGTGEWQDGSPGLYVWNGAAWVGPLS